MQQIEHYIGENGIEAVSRVIALGILAGLSFLDLKYRKISSSILAAGSVLAAAYILLFNREQFWLSAGGLGVGLLFVAVSRVTGEKLGYGDSWLLCILGAYMGLWDQLSLLAFAWLCVAAAAAAVLASGRCGRGTALPMIPFITAGYTAVWITEIMGCGI